MKKSSVMLYANIAILAIASLLYFALASPAAAPAMKQSKAYPIYRGSARGMASLQCAVTWNAAALDRILDELKAAEVDITFLVSGKWARANPEMLRRMQREGHEIGVMGYEPEKDGRAGFVKQDLQRALDIVESITGERPQTYYCGERNSAVSAAAASSLGLCTVLYTVDPDCSCADPELILNRLKGSVSEGSIVCVQPTAGFADALPGIIEYLKNIGLAIVPTHKMLYN